MLLAISWFADGQVTLSRVKTGCVPLTDGAASKKVVCVMIREDTTE